MRAQDLTVESRIDPVGIGVKRPAFGWKLAATKADAHHLRQAAYRILVAATPEELMRHSGGIWDSGRVIEGTYWERPYGGPPLQSHTTYYWQVQVWSDAQHGASWSSMSHFTTALLSDSDWTAQWIAAEPDHELLSQAVEKPNSFNSTLPHALPIFRHEIVINKPVESALLFVAGLGQYEVHLNGREITDTVMNSGWTDYRKTVSYDTYDITKLLHPHVNALGILLGNGMYNVEGLSGRYTKFVGSFGQPKCLLQLELRYRDGSSARFISNSSWQTHAGPVLYSSIYGGEDFDGRGLSNGWDQPDFSAKDWRSALEVPGPGGRLTAAQSAPLVIAESYRSIRKTEPTPGITVYDLGVNMSGWPSITVQGEAGSRVSLLAGELLNSDGTVTQRSANATPKDPVLFSYILRGGAPEHWHPRFSYYSFRYVQIMTEPASHELAHPKILELTGDFVHARAPIVGTFASSSKLYNRIHTLIDRAVLSNLASVVTDCPSREKLGWLEQTYLNAATLMLNYDVKGLYEKMDADMASAQLQSGLIPAIAPEYVAFVDKQGRNTWFRDSPEWGSAAILSPWALYTWTGDDRPLQENYVVMQRYADYLNTRLVNGLLTYGLGDWYDIGPGEPGESKLTSKSVTATGTYYEDLHVLAQTASLLHHSADAAAYEKRATAVRDAFNARLFHPETNQYDRGSQTANAIPLALGLVPLNHVQGVLRNLVEDIHLHGDHVTAGDVGFHYVVRALTDLGRSDVLAAMLSRMDSPSYGYQLSRGATTLTEAWDTNPASSQNHFMLGHGEEWFYRGLAGLSVDMSKGASHAILLQPNLVEGVDSASASYQAAMGLINIYWRRTDSLILIKVKVPAGAQGDLQLPEGYSWKLRDSDFARSTGRSPLHIDSGSYVFTAKTRSTASLPERNSVQRR